MPPSNGSNMLMAGVLNKLETMIQSTEENYEKSVILLSSIETVMKNEVSSELKAQTKLLISIERSLTAKPKQTITNKDKLIALGSFGHEINEIIQIAKKIEPGAGKNISEFFKELAAGLNKFVKSSGGDINYFKGVGDLIKSISENAIEYARNLIVVAPLLKISQGSSKLFGQSISELLDAFKDASDGFDSDVVDSVVELIEASENIMVYGKNMAQFLFIAPLANKGAIAFGKSVAMLLGTFRDIVSDKALKTEKKKQKSKKELAEAGLKELEPAQQNMFGYGQNQQQGDSAAIVAIAGIGQGVLMFGLSMMAYSLMAPVAMVGATLFGLTLRLILKTMGELPKQGIKDISILMGLGKGVLLFALSMVVSAVLFPIVLLGAGMFALTMVAISFAMNLIDSRSVRRGMLTLLGISSVIILFGLTMVAFVTEVSPESIMYSILAISTVSLALYVVGKNASAIVKGGLTLIFASLTMVIVSYGLLFFKKSEFTWDDAALLGVTITGLGAVMALAGVASELIIPGAASMMIAGIALMAITSGLKIFKDSGFGIEDGNVLKHALGSVVSGFLGGDFPGGIKEGIKFAAKAATRAYLLYVTVPPILFASLALRQITESLKTFKETNWTQSDSANMELAIVSVVKSFSLIGDKKRQKELGIAINPIDLMLGIWTLSSAGSTLSSLAKGIKAFANLEIVEYEVIDAGTSKARIVPKSVTKMTKSDFELASQGMALVISAIAEPFALVGKIQKGKSSGHPIYDAVFGGGFVSAGVRALKHAGDTIYNLAKGVQAFANLEITQYEVINSGTSNATIVPKSITKMNQGDFTNASTNIALVLSFLAKEIAKIGQMEEESSGIFSNGYVKKGVNAIAKLGGNILSIAEAVIKMANSEYTTYRVDDKGNLVPVATVKMTSSHFEAASKNIGLVLSTITKSFVDVGQFINDNKKTVNAALKQLPKITDGVVKTADAIDKWSKLREPEKVGDSVNAFMSRMLNVFDPSLTPTIDKSSGYFTQFAMNIDKIANPANSLDKFATNMERVEKSMKLTSSHINGMDLKKLTMTDSLMKSLAIMSKQPVAIGQAIKESIEEAFEQLVDAIKELSGETSNAPKSQPGTFGNVVAAINPLNKGKEGIDSNAIQQLILQLQQQNLNAQAELVKQLAALTLNVRVTNANEFTT